METIPEATAADLERAGVQVLLRVPVSNTLGLDDTIQTMRVPLSVLREWLKEPTT